MENMQFKENDAPILIVFGQSNAHGHATHLTPDEEINTPLTKVFGLSCQENQAYGLNDVTWSGFVTHDMNLGETQNHTVCLAESFARKWQNKCDNGADLPNLYVIQISIGAQGIAEFERDGINMWYKNRTPIMKKGSLDDVDISLYPLAIEILKLSLKNLRAEGKTPKIIGLHWNQWETEADTGGLSITNAKQNFTEVFEGFHDAIGEDFPLFLYQPISEVYNNPTGVKAIIELFAEFDKANENVHIIDLSKSAYYDATALNKGIFQNDRVHYSEEIHRYFAEIQWDFCKLSYSENFFSYKLNHSYFNGAEVLVAVPNKISANNKWVWRTEFFGAFPTVDLEMLNRGYYVIQLVICDRFGSPSSVEEMENFRKYIVTKLNLCEKAILFGFSRGGLYAINYAAKYSQFVDKLYLDAPVLDINSWPGGKKNGIGSKYDWELCLPQFSLTEETADSYEKIMQTAFDAVTAAKIPLVMVAGDCDEVVPYEENGKLLNQEYLTKELPLLTIIKKGCSHHPHSVTDQAQINEIADFLCN